MKYTEYFEEDIKIENYDEEKQNSNFFLWIFSRNYKINTYETYT